MPYHGTIRINQLVSHFSLADQISVKKKLEQPPQGQEDTRLDKVRSDELVDCITWDI